MFSSKFKLLQIRDIESDNDSNKGIGTIIGFFNMDED